MKNIYNKKLNICSINPLTGYYRDGYCRSLRDDIGNHLVCAKMNKDFLDYTAMKGNDLRSVVKEGEKWCLCQNRYMQAYNDGKQPNVILNSTNNNIKSYIRQAILKDNREKKIKKTKKIKKAKKKNKKKEKKGKWTKKYKKSINCNNPRGFSQKQYCKYGRNKKNKKKAKKKKRQ